MLASAFGGVVELSDELFLPQPANKNEPAMIPVMIMFFINVCSGHVNVQSSSTAPEGDSRRSN